MDDFYTEERSGKFSEIMLPLILCAFMCAYWAIVIPITGVEINHRLHSEKYEIEVEKTSGSVTLQLPDYGEYQMYYKEKNVHDGKVIVYYNVEEQTLYMPQTFDIWILFYGVGLPITFALLYWVKKILFVKKHAVAKPEREHSYKDY